MAALYHYGERSWRFRVESSDDIDISGLQNVTRAQVMEVMGGDIGRNIFFVPLAQRKAQLEQIPWVESASVMRFVPNRLKVEIHERTPVAFARVGSRILLTDAGGTLMELPGRKKYSFPVMLGMNNGEPPSTRSARMKIYNDVVSQLDAGGAHYSQELSEIDLSDPDDVKVMANNHAGEVLVHLGSSNYLERYKIYVTHVQEWQQQFDKLESVDLRYDRQIIVNPDLQGPMKQAPLSAEAARRAMAAGVKPAALITRISSSPRPSPALTVETGCDIRSPKRWLHPSRRQAQRPPRPYIAKHASVRRGPGAKPERKQSTLRRRPKILAAKQARAKVRRRGEGFGETEPGNCQGRNTIGMANQHEHLLTAIDVGSAKTCALVAEITDNGLRYRGHGVAESRGSRKGVIVDLDKAVSSIQKAVEQAEDVAGAPIEHALLGVAGAHARGFNSHGGLSFGARAREIGRDEIRSAVDKARAIPLPDDREILHLLPQEFILDDQTGVNDPLGMMAARLEVRVHMVTVASSALQNVVTAVNRAGVHVDDTVFEPLACADAVLRADERELGVCLADLGAGSTSLIVFQEGAVAHTAVIPVGGDHFTSDLSVGLCTPVAEAEKIKRLYGNAIVTLIPEGNEVEVPSVGRPSVAADFAAHGGRNPGAPRPRTVRDAARQPAPCRNVRALRGWHRADRRRMPLARHSRNRGVGAAPSAAAGLARAAGENAVHAGRARVRNGPGHGVLRTPRAYRSRHSERALEFKAESDVRRKRCIGICSAGILPAVPRASRSRRCGRDAPTTAAGTAALHWERASQIQRRRRT